MIQTLLGKVEHCLDKHPTTRDSDAMLTWALWHTYYPHLLFQVGGDHAVLLKNLSKLPSQDSIKRVRAKIQNEQKRFMPTDVKVLRRRGQKINEWRTVLGYEQTYIPY